MKLVLCESHRTPLMISWHWFRWWLGAIRELYWPSAMGPLTSLGHNELIISVSILHVMNWYVSSLFCGKLWSVKNIIWVVYHDHNPIQNWIQTVSEGFTLQWKSQILVVSTTQQTTTWINDDQQLWCHKASLGYNELNWTDTQLLSFEVGQWNEYHEHWLPLTHIKTVFNHQPQITILSVWQLQFSQYINAWRINVEARGINLTAQGICYESDNIHKHVIQTIDHFNKIWYQNVNS